MRSSEAAAPSRRRLGRAPWDSAPQPDQCRSGSRAPGKCPWRTIRRRPAESVRCAYASTKPATSASTACPSKRRAPRRKTSVSGSSSNDPGWRSWTTVSSLMAYPSFVENGDSNIARIRRPHLIPSPTLTFGYSSALHRTGQSLGERLQRVIQRQAPGRAAQWRNLLLAQGGPGADRALAAALQHGQTTQCAGLQTPGASDHRA